ncbi:MAG: PAS domain S-box protein [Flavobacteriales bacterium]|nr:PAS domain S-box protein [Flavobacteriales bacterium]
MFGLRIESRLVAIAIHSIIVVAFGFGAHQYLKEQREHKITNLSQELNGVVNTMARVSPDGILPELVAEYHQGVMMDNTDPDYLRISNMFQDILSSNGLEDCEMSVIVIDPEGQNMAKLISSESIYSSGEEFRDLNVDFESGTEDGNAQLIKITPSIWKLVAYRHITDFSGKKIGVLRLESANVKAYFSAFGPWWAILIPLLVYLVLAIIFTPRILNNLRTVKRTTGDSDFQEELQKKNTELKMLSLVAKKSENLMLITDEHGQILWVNETYETKNNYTAEELNQFVGKFLKDVSKNEHIQTIIKNVVDFRKALTYESSSTDQDGKRFYAMTTVTPIMDDTDKVSKLLFVDTDVTKVKRAQEENEIFKEFVNKSRYPRILLSKTGEVIFSNSAAEAVLCNWKGMNGKIKDDVMVMLEGIYTSGITEHLIMETALGRLNLNIHPDKQREEVFVIGESISTLSLPPADPEDRKKAG